MDIKYSKEIIDKAIVDYKPKAICMMLSGGDDSLAAYEVAKQLDIKIDFVIHGNTRTGIKETTQYVTELVSKNRHDLLIADAGSAYEKYVLRKGFFGLGERAHSFSYNVLKSAPFRSVISQYLRKGNRNFPVLLLNGARRLESDRRKRTMKSPIKIDPTSKNNIWVNLINEWDNYQPKKFLESCGVKRNPVSVNLCRSGECLCGTMQTYADRLEAGYFYPDWKNWIDSLEKEVNKKYPWKWGQNILNSHLLEMKGQTNLFQPMCEGCKINYSKINSL